MLFADVNLTDRHQCLRYSYSHPESIKKIIFSKTLRAIKICYCENNFRDHSLQMKL